MILMAMALARADTLDALSLGGRVQPSFMATGSRVECSVEGRTFAEGATLAQLPEVPRLVEHVYSDTVWRPRRRQSVWQVVVRDPDGHSSMFAWPSRSNSTLTNGAWIADALYPRCFVGPGIVFNEAALEDGLQKMVRRDRVVVAATIVEVLLLHGVESDSGAGWRATQKAYRVCASKRQCGDLARLGASMNSPTR